MYSTGIRADYTGIRFGSAPTEAAFRKSYRDGGRVGRWMLTVAVCVMTLGAPMLGPILLDSPPLAYQAQSAWLLFAVTPAAVLCLATLLHPDWYPASTAAVFVLCASGIVFLSSLTVTLTGTGQPQPLTALTMYTLMFCVLSHVRLLAGLAMVALTLAAGWLTTHFAAEPFQARDVFVFICMCLIGIAAIGSMEMTARRAWLARESLIWSATYDELTGILNRGAFEDQAERIIRMAHRQQSSLCVLCLDIDHFKRVNDTYGHLMGDEVIRCVGEVLRIACQRPLDLAGRVGGEEFLLAYYEVNAEQAEILAERVLDRVRGLRIQSDDEDMIAVTASIGATVGVPTAGTSLRDFVIRADRMMYLSKKQGRDRFNSCRLSDEAAADPQTPPPGELVDGLQYQRQLEQ